MNVLVVDVGNTRIKWRIAAIDGVDAESAAAQAAGSRSLADIADLVDAWRAHAVTTVAAAFVSNVALEARAEQVTAAIETVWPDAHVRVVAATKQACGVVNGYDDATRLGSDRWLALIAAHALEPAGPVLVCGFGTATTIDLLLPAVDGSARFAGGLILPGLDTMREALAASTARLPRAHGDVVDFGTSTDDAIASGIAAAQLGAVALSIAAARERLASLATSPVVTCVFAGGGAVDLSAEARRQPAFASGVRVRVVPDLVLRGLLAVAFDTLLRKRTVRSGR